jgi:23S rRNA pseudouridine955/2504/2580 synthase/23S rRNA pseudouridine1911/1915/1917 synthase
MKHTPDSLQRRKVRSSIDWSSCGQTLVNFLSSRFPYRDSDGWKNVIANGEITINGKAAAPDMILALHDVVEYQPGELPEPPADMDYKIIFEDENLLVINKPGNLCVHPAGPFFKHTLWHMLCSKYGDIHFVNRLDRETSGLMIAVKNKQTASKFTRRELILEKIYTVMVYGRFPEKVCASGFLCKDYNSSIRKKRHFHSEEPEVPSESAETLLELLSTNGCFSLVRATLGTGRMHQIRATVCSLGYPVVGDKLYGPDETFYLKQKSETLTDEDKKLLCLPRQALHASKLVFEHPYTGEKMTFTSPAPFSIPENRIVVTGAAGFIGSHFVNELNGRGFSCTEISRTCWENDHELSSALAGAEKIVHFAGLSRHADGEFLYRSNMALSETLCRVLSGKKTTVYFASSPHVRDHDLPYHKSKRDGAALLREAGIGLCVLMLPNTFGPGSKPFYNSVVSTFAALAAQGREPEKVDDVILKLLPVRELCRQAADLLFQAPQSEFEIAHAIELPLPELWQRLNRQQPEDELDGLLFEIRSLSVESDKK